MLLGIYSDPHISYSSSILPIAGTEENSNYTYRLESLIKSYRWMYNIFDENNVGIICNCGDTFDNHTLRSEEITAFSKCLSYSKGVQEIHIVGNHDMLNSNFYCNSFVKDYDFIELYDKPYKVNDTISVMPYRDWHTVTPAILRDIQNDVLLSHLDIKNSIFTSNTIADEGVDTGYLDMFFKATFNGHIHSRQKFCDTKNLVMNVGSLMSHSFSDSNTYVPGITIYDTEKHTYKCFNNPHAPLFRKINADTITKFLESIKKLNKNYKYVIRATVPFEIRDQIKSILEESSNIIITYRIVTTVRDNKTIINNTVTQDIIYNDDAIENKFFEFLDKNQELLKFPANSYKAILERK